MPSCLFSINSQREVDRGVADPEKHFSSMASDMTCTHVTRLRGVSPLSMMEEMYVTSYAVNE